MYYDTHSHLNLEQFTDDWRDAVSRLREHYVRTTTVGTTAESSAQAIKQAHQYPELLRATVGIHPAYITAQHYADLVLSLEQIDTLAGDPLCVGIGECGYDFYKQQVTPELIAMQDHIFVSQIRLAIQHNKPLMLHVRPTAGTYDAYERVIGTLRAYSGQVTGQAHFYAGTLHQARQLLDMGFYISCTGVITFTRDYDDVLRYVPVNRLLCETDSPYVAPIPYRGTRAEPWHVIRVYERLAEIVGAPIDDLRQQLQSNVQTLYGV